jgi:O-antigen biosynthesis protein WbqV
VGGTRNVADACREAGVGAMILISTDKAVNPTNVMGATKRIAEGYCQALDIADGRQGGTRFLTVRFGNVLGSTGSVVPLFEHQLRNGGPLTVTDEKVERYFMTVREAVELVLQASTLGLSEDGDKAGEIFVLDMGKPVRIFDLAEQMIRLAGLRPGKDIEIRITGLRPGEKLSEELFHGSEPLKQTDKTGILVAAPRTADHAVLSRAVDELVQSATDGRTEDTVRKIKALVPEFRPATIGPSATSARIEA